MMPHVSAPTVGGQSGPFSAGRGGGRPTAPSDPLWATGLLTRLYQLRVIAQPCTQSSGSAKASEAAVLCLQCTSGRSSLISRMDDVKLRLIGVFDTVLKMDSTKMYAMLYVCVPS